MAFFAVEKAFKFMQRMDMWTQVEWDELGDQDCHIYTTVYKIDCQWEAALWLRELSWAFCDDLCEWDGGWEEGARRKRYMYT